MFHNPVCTMFCWLFVCASTDGRAKLPTLSGRGEQFPNITDLPLSVVSGSAGQELEVCTGDLLDQRHYRFQKKDGGNNRFMSQVNGPCRLVRYTTERIISCFDLLHDAMQLAGELSNKTSSLLHFVFMGDSRTRQHFYNFVRLIPDYDQIRQPIRISSSFHGDIEMTSHILRLRLSYKWRPLIDDNVTETIRQWATCDPPERPQLIFLSIVVHNMLGINGADNRFYEKKFKKLAPELGRLANVTRVIWLNQYPVVELHDYINTDNTCIHSEKIHNYNKAIRRMLENENNRIRIWDSTNPLVEDYVRSCAMLKRDEIFDVQRRPYMYKDGGYTDCNDYIHTGYSALSQATNLFYNDLCNNAITSLS